MHRRVTGRLPEGYQSVREGYQSVRKDYQSVREGYQSLQEGYRSLHKSAEVEIFTYGRDLRVYWWVKGRS